MWNMSFSCPIFQRQRVCATGWQRRQMFTMVIGWLLLTCLCCWFAWRFVLANIFRKLEIEINCFSIILIVFQILFILTIQGIVVLKYFPLDQEVQVHFIYLAVMEIIELFSKKWYCLLWKCLFCFDWKEISFWDNKVAFIFRGSVDWQVSFLLLLGHVSTTFKTSSWVHHPYF